MSAPDTYADAILRANKLTQKVTDIQRRLAEFRMNVRHDKDRYDISYLHPDASRDHKFKASGAIDALEETLRVFDLMFPEIKVL